MPSERFGLSCALALPLKNHFEIDYRRLTAHAHQCLDGGCSSITVFGTTGEGASVSLAERRQVLDALVAAQVNLRQQVFGGVTAASVGDAVEQALLLGERSCRGVLLAPPFYFKSVSEEGLYAWFSQVFAQITGRVGDVILYNIPAVTEIELSVGLIARLKRAFPDMVKGVKDSGTDWTYTEKLLRTHDDLLILIGNELHLAAGARLGTAGAISGLANLCPQILLEQLETAEEDSRIVELASELHNFPFIPAVKSLLSKIHGDPAWLNVRPPLTALLEEERARLNKACSHLLLT